MFLLARSSSFTSDDGLVDRVSIHRPMLPLPHEQAIADRLNTVKALGIDPENIGARLKAQSRGPRDYKALVEFPAALEGVDLRIELESESGDAWTYSLEWVLK